MDFINYIGYYGPVILILVNIYALSQYPQHLYLYLPFLFMNDIIFNPALKVLIKDPRPIGYQKSIGIDKDNIYINAHIYGMPSGHAQMVFYSTTFLYLSLRNMNVLYFCLAVSLLTVSQRVVFNYHTPLQVIVGAIVGICMGYLIYYIARNKIVGRITEKLDDFAAV